MATQIFASMDTRGATAVTINTAPSFKRLEVKHETSYHYQSSVALGYSLAWLTPLSTKGQRLLEHRLNVLPKPRFQHESVDAFGNTQHYFEMHKAHSELRVQSYAIVESGPAPDVAALTMPWESQRPKGIGAAIGEPPPWEFIYSTVMAPLHTNYTEYARAIFTPGRALGEALLAFNHQLHIDFQYVPGSTQVDTPLEQVWENRAGVCQDFAHLAIAALRGLGLAVAYVSGYLLTYAREGEKKNVGADASHAWFAVWANEHGWIHLDPTNDKVVGDEHIVLAMGRDYDDTPPVKGVCFGGGLHHLRVGVTVNDISASISQNAQHQTQQQRQHIEQEFLQNMGQDIAQEMSQQQTQSDLMSAADDIES
ncbi:MAG: Transglutaminase-like enzyme putative cysteine protease [Verrucomicrobiaceae bacterium]|nr:Transglutaminase-like enzyme putative cysteine protease [Verrucomicrobiaceae bacterium]